MIIGLTGPSGSGKGTAARFLIRRGFEYHSCSDILRDILKKEGTEETIQALANLGNSIRSEHGAGELAKRLLQKIADNQEKNTIVDSIRNIEEVNELRNNKEFVLISIDAPLKTRHTRITRRGRPGDDISFNEFERSQQEQMNGKGNKMQISKCMEIADFKINNTGTIQDLEKKLEDCICQKE